MKVKKLSDDLHERVLGYKPVELTKRAKVDMQDNLKRFNLETAIDRNDVVNLPLPSWAKDFRATIEEAVALYGTPTIKRLEQFSKQALPELPSKPENRPGWQKQLFTSRTWEKSTPPTSKTAMVLDFETVEIEEGCWIPSCCVAVTEDAWYVWANNFHNPVRVAPFSQNQVVIGHNVGYDRSYLGTEYKIADSGNRFFDTMAAWVTCRGFTNQQRAIVALADKEDDFLAPAWVNETGKNGLDDVYEFYTGKQLDKGVRDSIVKLGLPFVMDNMADILAYAIHDVLATMEVYKYVFPELRQSQPSDISLTGQILLGNTWLPLSSDRWYGYYDRAEAKCKEVDDRVDDRLWQVVEEVLAKPTARQLEDLDWTPAKTGKQKGLPQWYRDCLAIKRKGGSISGKRIAPILLGCTWRGEPVQWAEEDVTDKYGNSKVGAGWWTPGFGWLPHPEKRGQKLTDLFMQKMVKTVEDDTLTAPGGLKELLLDMISTVNWVSLRKRVKAIKTESPEGFPTVLPQIVVTGTITRRCKDNVWQVVANPKATRIGTELKSMIEAPAGYKLVGADVDSQELWIAACYGDAKLGYNGSTPLGLMILVGTKEDGTDPHSVLANTVGVNRETAKVLNYGMVYGQGLKGTMDVMLKENPLMTVAEAKAKGLELLSTFKGDRSDYTSNYVNGLASDSFNAMEKLANSKCPATPVLEAKISAPLRGIKDFATTRVNWTVQSLGVDFRDIYVTYLRYFFQKLGIEGRLLMSLHDEFRTCVKDSHTKRAVYALQLAHLYTRAFFVDSFGLDCIPAGIAWHSSVDVDTVFRKSPTKDQLTPSQTISIAPGYEVKPKDMLEWWLVETKV